MAEWIQVRKTSRQHGERKKSWDINEGGYKNVRRSKETTTFFVTEFPEECGAKELYAIFKDYGEIDEVIIPPRRDRRGKKFGFARFFNVTDTKMMAIRLDNIIIGSRKIHTNLPRFSRYYEGETNGGKFQTRQKREMPAAVPHCNRGGNVYKRDHGGKRKTYAQVVSNQNNRKVVDNLTHAKKVPFAHLEYNLEEEELTKFQKAFVGVVENSGTMYNLQEYFNMEGYFGVKVTPLGANLCLLEEDVEGELKALIDDASEWINQWFTEIRPWKPQDVDNERLTWLRIFGLPCHAWNPNVFEFMSKPIGVYVCSDTETTKQSNMDIARILVRTKFCMVLNETYSISINNIVYNIEVVEDSHGPMRILTKSARSLSPRNSDACQSSEDEDEGGAWNYNTDWVIGNWIKTLW
ncbi:uncharacterized protein LOC131631431 [Vicia villosa]|uniref:uncharacterized protein LOC131631431 n=1 Tax=Vicia villosa TaxID=3911 RepID=UPI00273C506F|nr:uncharacterized protein LOC131631431 [Vicia villosa]